MCLHAYRNQSSLFTVPQCRKIVKDTVDKFGRIDVLVNNASFQGKDAEKFEDITRERLEFTFHSNILAYFSVAQAAVPHIPRGGAIINIASIQGYQPSFGVLDYACTKVAYPWPDILAHTSSLPPVCCTHIACCAASSWSTVLVLRLFT